MASAPSPATTARPNFSAEIDEVNAFVYEHVNNGVYRAGFAKTQAAYDEAVAKVFRGLDWMEERLSRQRYLAGDRASPRPTGARSRR